MPSRETLERSRLRPFQKGVISLAFVFLLLCVAEMTVRLYYFCRNGYDVGYLTDPSHIKPPQVHFPRDPKSTYLYEDRYSGRRITYTINQEGARGSEWSLAKPQGALRIVALGASSTFGVNSPDEATWPAFLERALRETHGKNAEVLNGGYAGKGLLDLKRLFASRIAKYQPDWVLLYEGYNETGEGIPSRMDKAILDFHNTWLGKWSFSLYYRSMLYTYLLEKILFLRAARGLKIAPDLQRFETRLKDLVQTLKEHHATPIFVLQMLEPTADPTVQKFRNNLRDFDLKDQGRIQKMIVEAVEANNPFHYDRWTHVRVYQTYLLEEAMRRMAQDWGIRCIDPSAAFVRYRERTPLFCDVVHMADRGNRLLAEAVAEHLKEVTNAP